jgi:hypothetical protein
MLDIAVEGLGHRHHVRLLVFEHLGHTERSVLGVRDLTPQAAAALAQPGIEFDVGAEALTPGVLPDAAPAVLHVLLDDTFSQPTGTLQKSASNR